MQDLDLKKSSNLHWARYDEGSRRLEVDFKNSAGVKVSTYEYRDFPPEEWQALNSSDSKGRYFAYSIRPLYDKGGIRYGLARKVPAQPKPEAQNG